MKTWQRVASEADLNEKGALALRVAGQDIGLFEVDDQYYAIENACPHAYAYTLLSEGIVKGARVECRYHNAQFHIPSGKCIRRPGRDLKKYLLRVDEGQIYVKVQLPIATDQMPQTYMDSAVF